MRAQIGVFSDPWSLLPSGSIKRGYGEFGGGAQGASAWIDCSNSAAYVDAKTFTSGHRMR